MNRNPHRPLAALAAAIAGLLAGAQPLHAALSYETAQRVARSIVEITASGCASGDGRRIGTGFIFERADQIVTANHVVAGCYDISLWYERAPGQPRKRATLTRVLVRNDLALLAVDDPPVTESPLRHAPRFNPDEELKAIGYAVGQPTLGDLDLRVSIGSDRLEDMLPTSNRQEISRNTSIDLNARIFRFSRPLYPGMSGGPIFNAAGEVVAIAAGGLQSGAVAASWGWPADLLPQLLASGDSFESSDELVESFFTFAERDGAAETRTCGGLVFTRLNTLPFGEIAETSDNIFWLELMVSVTSIPRVEIEAFMFDVWSHQESGATVIIPAGADLVQASEYCVAQSASGRFGQIVWGQEAENEIEAQAASVEFENQLIALAQPFIGVEFDVIFGQQGLQVREDGLAVNRKAVYFVKSLGLDRAESAHALETVMTRGGSFVGVVTINEDAALCLAGVQWAPCEIDPASIEEWARFALATQMTTYPIF